MFLQQQYSTHHSIVRSGKKYHSVFAEMVKNAICTDLDTIGRIVTICMDFVTLLMICWNGRAENILVAELQNRNYCARLLQK